MRPLTALALRLEILFWDGWIGLLKSWGPRLPLAWTEWLGAERAWPPRRVTRRAGGALVSVLLVVSALAAGGLLNAAVDRRGGPLTAGSLTGGPQSGGPQTGGPQTGGPHRAGIVSGLGAGAPQTGIPQTGVPQPDAPPLGVVPSSAPPEVKTGQRNLLLIVVDEQDGRQPQLEGVWLGVILPPTPRLIWLPVYPSKGSQDVRAAFALVDGAPVEAFWETLRGRQLWWDASLVVGRAEIDTITAPGLAGWPWGVSENGGGARAQADYLAGMCRSGGAASLVSRWLGTGVLPVGLPLTCEFPTLGRAP